MLERGVNLAPSAYEAGFVSAAHDYSHLEQTIEKAAGVFQLIYKKQIIRQPDQEENNEQNNSFTVSDQFQQRYFSFQL